ncbi:ATP-binding protein [Quadrisphaera setariae]|uniref:ATP-binding protein n=1 Tax=Quadrisphaera setariae TaxID=2593304 RepID=A0A5C8ZF17_9ACTN|nr:ATP-binding protein [Quadrisphaera setariae]TXR56655.1 ATP-binding protein [Quadrisphaera setariae]
MDPVANPYAPGAGRTPAALVGRDRQREAWRVGLDRVERGRTAQPVVLYGLRGVGKTVLLSSFRSAAAARGWVVAQVEAGRGSSGGGASGAGSRASLRGAIGEALHAPLVDLARPSAGRRLLAALRTALSFKASYDTAGTWNFGVDLGDAKGGGADTGVLEADLAKLVRDVSAGAAEEGVGLALLVDEAQDATADELAALCAVAHAAGQQDWPVLVALAGLPSLPRVLAEAKSYAERLFVYERIEQLPPDAAVQALVAPAVAEGVHWTDGAVELVVAATGGYPYFLQQFGQECWNEAEGGTIAHADARVGAARGRAALDDGFFRSRWDRATSAEQAYLRAMAADGDAGSPSGEVAARLGRKVASLGPARASLIAKGLVYAPEHGVVAFTVPGMADFIGRQPAG